MLTGDSKATAQAVAKRPGIDEVIAEVLPKQNTEKSRPLLGTELPAVRIGNTIIHSNKDGKIH